MQISYKNEILRKLIHVSSLWIPSLYYFLDQKNMLLVISLATFSMVTIDILRSKCTKFSILEKIFSCILRDHEKIQDTKFNFTGASYMMLSVLLVILIFPKIVAILAISVLVISDTVAALIGRKFGKHKIMYKSLEGSIAFALSGFIVSILIGYLFNEDYTYYISAFISVIVGTLVELFSDKIKLDDNFSIPISIGCAYTIVNGFIL